MTDEPHQSRTPRLRFPEFQDAGEWEEKRLGTLLLRSPDYGVNAPAVPYAPDLPAYLRITDISEDGLYLTAKKVSVAIDAIDENYLHEGDLVLTRTGASVGKSYQYKKEDGKLVFAGFLIRIRPDQKQLNPTFLFNFLSTQQYWKWVGITSARSGQPGINSSEYASLLIPIPPDAHGRGLAEQQKIADCLSSLDGVITAQRAKLDALASHKQGLMQQLFPAEGETVPRLRFPEFQDAGEWEETKLYEIAHPVLDKANKLDINNILTLSSEHGLIRQNDYFGKKIAGESVERYIKVIFNDFVYNDRTTKLFAYGTIKRLSRYDSGIVSPIYKCFRFISKDNPSFWGLYFDSGFHETQLHTLINEGARAGRFNISIEKFLSITVYRPTLSEQQKIAECLGSLDALISDHREKLAALLDLKHGLMQQLFPMAEEVDA